MTFLKFHKRVSSVLHTQILISNNVENCNFRYFMDPSETHLEVICYEQGSTFPGAQGQMPLYFAVGP